MILQSDKKFERKKIRPSQNIENLIHYTIVFFVCLFCHLL